MHGMPTDNSTSTAKCSRCHSDNPLNQKYCGHCGAALDATQGAIEAYLEAHLSQRIDDIVKGRFGSQEVAELTVTANVAEKLLSWSKLFAVAVGIPLTIVAGHLAFLGYDYKNTLAESKKELDAVKQQIQASQLGAAEIERTERELRDKLHQSSQVVEQLTTLSKTVGNLQEKVQALPGGNVSPALVNGSKVFGPDISAHSVLDWPKIKAAGVGFVFIKATQGQAFQDTAFKNNWALAKSTGILRGAYHYLTGGDIAKQVDNFTAVLTQEAGDLPPVIDFEEGVTGSQPTLEELNRFSKLLEEKTGCVPIIYGGQYLKEQLLKSSDPKDFARYPLWLAQFSATPVAPKPWDAWSFWQFNDGYQFSNLPKMSFNIFNGSQEELQAFAKRSCKPR